MKKISVVVLFLLLLFSATACSNSGGPNNQLEEKAGALGDSYIGQAINFSNGVQFTLLDYQTTNKVGSYTTENIFLIITVRVYNGSSEAFRSDATDVCLMMENTKILQQSFVSLLIDGYDDISQSATTTKEYKLYFEIGKGVAVNTLNLEINNGKILNSEKVTITLNSVPVFSYKELYYTKNDDNITIVGCASSTKTINIPNKIQGIPVTAIADKAFANKTELTSATIPDSVSSIGKGVFQNCTTLTSVSLPNGIKKISSEAFRGCVNLKNINIPSSLEEINDYAFSGCKNLNIKNLIIPDNVSIIGFYAFSSCNFDSVLIPTSVTLIDYAAFTNQATTIYYKGTFEQWSKIELGTIYDSINGIVTNQTSQMQKYYYSESQPDWNALQPNKYWRYDENGNIFEWENK